MTVVKTPSKIKLSDESIKFPELKSLDTSLEIDQPLRSKKLFSIAEKYRKYDRIR